MNSVLLVGSDLFCASVIAQVRSLEALKVTSSLTSTSAVEAMEMSMPDVAIVQASCLQNGSVDETFGEAYSSPYYVLIEEPGQLVREGESRYSSQALVSKSLISRSLASTASASNRVAYSVDQLSDLYVEEKAIALESGADAYLWRLSEELALQENVDRDLGRLVAAQPSSGPMVTDFREAAKPIMSFRKSQQRLIQAHIHIGISRAQRYRDLSRINDWLSAVALADALTQLNNRRAFDIELPRQVRTARSKSRPLSLMVIDIDYFKMVNDRHGHLVGDDVLKQLAKRLLGNMRFYDAPFRYGGEEFVVTLSNTDAQEAAAIAERLRQSIEKTPFKLDMLADGMTALDITVSIGLTQLDSRDDERGASFLHRADQNLLRAKAEGRNRVVVDE